MSGSSVSRRCLRARRRLNSAAQSLQWVRCVSSSLPIAWPSAVSSNWSFHFTQALFISSLPIRVFLPCASASARSPGEDRARNQPEPHPFPQPRKAAIPCEASSAACQWHDEVARLEDALPLDSPRLLSRLRRLATLYLAQAAFAWRVDD